MYKNNILYNNTILKIVNSLCPLYYIPFYVQVLPGILAVFPGTIKLEALPHQELQHCVVSRDVVEKSLYTTSYSSLTRS